jgi:hypothetical protein
VNIENIKNTILINALGVLKNPMLAICTPRVVDLTDERCELKIRLDYRTRNHLGTMYFGALAIGAELSVVFKAIQDIRAVAQKAGQKIDFIFKDFSCQFLKRPDGHVHFICEQGLDIKAMVEKACLSSERFSKKLSGFAVVPTSGDEPVLKYDMTLSIRNRTLQSKSS